MSIYDASVEYAKRGTPLAILAGKSVRVGVFARLGGEGAAALLGIRFVIAESYEADSRSNLVGWGFCRCSFCRGRMLNRCI